MTGICHTQLLQSVALIEWDHMLLAGKDQSFFSTLFRKLLEIFHKLSCDPLMTVFRDHIQSEYRLDLPVLSVKRDIMIKFIREYWFICGSSVDKAYDLLILYCYNEILRECSHTLHNFLMTCCLRRWKTDCLDLCQTIRLTGICQSDL